MLKNADVALYRAKTDGRNAFRFYEPEHGQSAARPSAISNAIGAQCLRARRVRAALPAASSMSRPGASAASKPCCAGATRERGWCRRRIHPAGRRNRPDRPARRMGAAGGLRDAAVWPRDRSRSTSRRCSSQPGSARPSRCARRIALRPPGWSWKSPRSALLRTTARRSPRCTRCAPSASRIAMDDFGTGYSSLSYLQQLSLRQDQDRPVLRQRHPSTARGPAIVRDVTVWARVSG